MLILRLLPGHEISLFQIYNNERLGRVVYVTDKQREQSPALIGFDFGDEVKIVRECLITAQEAQHGGKA